MDNLEEFEDVCIADIRQWQDTRPFKLLQLIVEQRKKEIDEQRLSRAYVEKPDGHLKLNYFLGYADAVEDILAIMQFDVIEESDK